jgi:hypothetical protein
LKPALAACRTEAIDARLQRIARATRSFFFYRIDFAGIE